MRIVPVWCRSLLIPGCLAISAGAEQMGDFGSDVEGTIQSVALRPAREDSPSSPSGVLMHNATPGMGAARAQEPQSFLKYQRFGGSVTTREEDDRVVALELEEKARKSKRADARAAGTRTAARLLLPLTLLLILVVAALAVSGRARRRSR